MPQGRGWGYCLTIRDLGRVLSQFVDRTGQDNISVDDEEPPACVCPSVVSSSLHLGVVTICDGNCEGPALRPVAGIGEAMISVPQFGRTVLVWVAGISARNGGSGAMWL